MAMFWDPLDRPPAKGEGPDQQGRQGQSRRQWAHSCCMGKIADLGEELDMDLVRVHEKERARMSEAVSQLILGICDAASEGATEAIPMVVGYLSELAEKGVDPEDEESHYSDEEDHGEVDPAVAARGLGQVGNVPIQDTLWSRCALEDLRSRYQKWRKETRGVGSSDRVGVREMLDALVRDGVPSRHANVQEASGKAQVSPKSSEKCAFILNSVKQNARDGRKPRGFQLPQIEHLRDSILLGWRQKLNMAKLDLSNCFWSLRLPRSWVGEFSVCVGDAQYVWQSLPFGWKYSPLLCQKLVYNVVRTSVWWLLVLFFVYKDDILIVGTRRFVRKAVHRARHRLQRVGFVISPKSVTEPSHNLNFVGKVFDLIGGTLENSPRMRRGLVRLWLLLVSGWLNRKGMERLLGRLEWALRPSAGLSPFLAGAYCWKHGGVVKPRVPCCVHC